MKIQSCRIPTLDCYIYKYDCYTGDCSSQIPTSNLPHKDLVTPKSLNFEFVQEDTDYSIVDRDHEDLTNTVLQCNQETWPNLDDVITHGSTEENICPQSAIIPRVQNL